MTKPAKVEKRMKGRLAMVGTAALAAVVLISTCNKKSNPNGPDDGGEAVPTYSYIKIGDTTGTIRITVPEQVDTSRQCEPIADTLVVTYDTFPSYFMLFSFTLSGNTLTIVHNDTAYYNRSGSGSGLTGTWTVADTVADLPVQLVFTDTTVALTPVETAICNDEDFVQYVWPFDSADYYLTLTRVSCNQVQLTGTVSGETVTLTWNSRGDLTYTSTNGSHGQYTYYINPTSCPNGYQPSWYYTGFLVPNSRSTPAAKQAARTPAPPPRKKRPPSL